MSKFGSAIGVTSSSMSGHGNKSKNIGKASNRDVNDKSASAATAKLQAAIARRQLRRQQKKTEVFNKNDNAQDSATSSISATNRFDQTTSGTMYDPAVDSLTIPTASSSSSQGSSASTDSLNALARENTPTKCRTPVGSRMSSSTIGVNRSLFPASSGAMSGPSATPGNRTPQKVSTTISGTRSLSYSYSIDTANESDDIVDKEEKDDCREMFTPIVPRKKGRNPKRVPQRKDSLASSTLAGESLVSRKSGGGNGNTKVNHSKIDASAQAEELLRLAKVKNEELIRHNKSRQESYEALTQLMGSGTTLKTGNTTSGSILRTTSGASNGTAFDHTLSMSISRDSNITYRPDAGGCNNRDAPSHGTGDSAATQPLYLSQSLNVLDCDRVRYVRFNDDITTFEEEESSHNHEHKAKSTSPLDNNNTGPEALSPFVKMHHVHHHVEESRSEFEIELEQKMVEHKIEVKRVGDGQPQKDSAAALYEISATKQRRTKEAAIRQEAASQRDKPASPTFEHPESDPLLSRDPTLYIDHNQVTYAHKPSPDNIDTRIETRYGIKKNGNEYLMELEAPETKHTAHLLSKPTLSFGSQAAISDVTGLTQKLSDTNSFDYYGTFEGGDDEYQYARATAQAFRFQPCGFNNKSTNGHPAAPTMMQQGASFVARLGNKVQQSFKECVQPSGDQLDSPRAVKMIPPAGIGGRLRDCIAPRKEFMVMDSTYKVRRTNGGMMSI